MFSTGAVEENLVLLKLYTYGSGEQTQEQSDGFCNS